MEKAKAAVSDFMNKSGHHNTTVHETVAPGVQHEAVKPHRHEDITTAVDKEVHQDHYHRTVQPVHDREVLPEKHTHNLSAVAHREFDHRDHEGTKRTLEADQGAFKNQSVTHESTHSQSAAPTVSGEHVHHHIHETIQPVIHKETVQPHVVHTTVPIHETHHHAAKHHETSHLPAVSMAEFKEKGGVLGGREERYDGFEGEPKNIGGAVAAGLKGRSHRRDDSHQSGDLSSNATGNRTTGHGLGTDSKHTHQDGLLGATSDRHTGRGLGTESTHAHQGGLTDNTSPKVDTVTDGRRGMST